MGTEFRVKTKKIIQSGRSLIVILPKDYVERTGLRKGDTVSITYNGILIILNPKLRGEARLNNELAH